MRMSQAACAKLGATTASKPQAAAATVAPRIVSRLSHSGTRGGDGILLIGGPYRPQSLELSLSPHEAGNPPAIKARSIHSAASSGEPRSWRRRGSADAPELTDPVDALEVGERQDVEQLGTRGGTEGVEAGSCTIPTAGANTPRSATPSAWPRPASCRRSARSAIPTTTPCRVGRRPLHDRSDPPNRSVEGDRRRRVRDAGVGGLVQPPTPARADRPRPAVGVRGRLLEEGGLNGNRSTQRTQPPVNPGRFRLRRHRPIGLPRFG